MTGKRSIDSKAARVRAMIAIGKWSKSEIARKVGCDPALVTRWSSDEAHEKFLHHQRMHNANYVRRRRTQARQGVAA